MSNYIYVIGEQQSAVITEEKNIFEFTAANMKAINTEELYLVISNFFAKGEFFPGPQEVLTSIIHETVRRWENFDSLPQEDHCTIITSFRLINGEPETACLASIPTANHTLTSEEDETFYSFLLEKLPQFQEKLTNKAYAPDSKLIAIIKDSATHHSK